MKTGGGDFSAEAYQQLREAYDKEQQRQVDDEIKGTQLMGQEYGLETLPVDSPWKGKIENWKYPSGKSAYTDEKQDPNEILQIMRDAAQERIDARKTEDEEEEVEQPMSDEEFDKIVDDILEEEDESEEDESEEEEDDETDEEDEEVEEETEDDEESEDEPETDDEQPEEDEEEETFDPEEIAEQIAALRAEIEGLNFVPEESSNDEPD